jgi:hypothetical protein
MLIFTAMKTLNVSEMLVKIFEWKSVNIPEFCEIDLGQVKW